MKVSLPEPQCLGNRPACRRRPRQRGSAVLIVLILLSMMLIYVNANLKLLWQVDRELKLIEKRQLLKFENPGPTSLEGTNAIPQSSADSRPTRE